MSLRTRLLGFFGLLAVLPLVGTGVLHYVHSMRTVESHIAAQVELIAERAATEIGRRHAIYESDLRLLAENTETQRLFRSLSTGSDAEADGSRAAAAAYLEEVWRRIGSSYHAVELRDRAGRTVLVLGDRGGSAGRGMGAPAGGVAGSTFLEHAILEETTAEGVGVVVAEPRLAQLLPTEALDARFGAAGVTLVVDRRTGRVVYSSRGNRMPWGPGPSTTDLGFDPLDARFRAPAGRFGFVQGDSTRVSAFASVESPAWTVISIAALEEFSAPFERMRALDMGVVLVVILLVCFGSVLLVRRATRSLEELTAAAAEVARGDLEPALPASGPDEVGRLSAAFAVMLDRIRETIAQLQASRQMAAVGEFASELAHEIRNPLTSVKLNLQRIERAVWAADVPPEAGAPLRIALREVARLERVVRGVLDLGRPRPLQRGVVSLHELAAEAVEVVRPEAEAKGARIDVAFAAEQDVVLADPDQLRAALLNLLLNGLEATPGGGSLTVRTALPTAPDDRPGAIELTVADTGPGIPAAARAQLFRPFFTTKPEGTGLGLAVALRTVEEHGGRLELVDDGEAAAGATFRILLPLLVVPAHAVPADAGALP